MRNIVTCLSIFVLTSLICLTVPVKANAENITVVIDPGHGGSNLGGQTDEYTEQELTLETSKYMAERLREYEGIDVYLTHDTLMDKDLTREQRGKIAAGVNADFIFSLHFNMSVDHDLYGAEVWTSAFGDYYKKGQEFAKIEMEGLHDELGFFDRGIKTRLNDSGDDYYGIILYGKKAGIPTVIIEHLHLDEERDNYFLKENDNPCKLLGFTDADAVAKYFKLKSASLGIDYSDFEYEEVNIPDKPVKNDTTAPDICEIRLESADEDSCEAKVNIRATDLDSKILYYQYSTDGGSTFSKSLPWNDDEDAKEALGIDNLTISVPLSEDNEMEFCVKVLNQFDGRTLSNVITLPRGKQQTKIVEKDTSDYTEIRYELKENEKEDKIHLPEIMVFEEKPSEAILYMAGGVLILTLFISVFIVLSIKNAAKKRKRRKRSNRRY